MIKSIICDMDGVIYRGKELIGGAQDFVAKLLSTGTHFLFLTNNSEQTPLDLKRKLEAMGIHGLKEENFITSAMATARFLSHQHPHGTAYVIGGGGIMTELYNAGFSITDSKPDYVVVGKTSTLNFEMLKKATNLILQGSKFIATNPDTLDRMESGYEPSCGSIIAVLERATEHKPYIVGKPNALMMTIAMNELGASPAETLMIGDRMDTDVVAGMEAGMKTCLVLSGVSDRKAMDKFPYRPDYVYEHVGEIPVGEM